MAEYVKTFEEDVVERLTRIEEHTASGRVRVDDHEGRIRAMEKRQWLLAGAAVVLGPVLAKLGLHIPPLS